METLMLQLSSCCYEDMDQKAFLRILLVVAVLLVVSLSVVLVAGIMQPPGEDKYAALSDQEKQRIVDEVWSRLAAQNYTEQIVGWGYTDEGFEVLFKGKADPNVISIIREVIDDLPLKIHENATCKKL